MDITSLQRRLLSLGYSLGAAGADGLYGDFTRAAVLAALTDGPDFALDPDEVEAVAARWGVHPGKILAFADVEASGKPFIDGRPVILPERHRFSRNSGRRFDASHPALSAPNWDRRWYPRSQAARYGVLLDWIGLDVDAAFASCSYGAFQILGENHRVCGADTPWAFAWRQAQTEGDQFEAFTRFIEGNGLVPAMRAARPGDAESCVPLVRRYNGTAFRENDYHTRYARQLVRRGVPA